jgi:hypothetical protein
VNVPPVLSNVSRSMFFVETTYCRRSSLRFASTSARA